MAAPFPEVWPSLSSAAACFCSRLVTSPDSSHVEPMCFHQDHAVALSFDSVGVTCEMPQGNFYVSSEQIYTIGDSATVSCMESWEYAVSKLAALPARQRKP